MATSRTMVTKLQLGTSIWFFYVLACAFGQDLLTCEVTSTTSDAGHLCDGNRSKDHCRTFAVLRTNSYYSSLSNLSSYLGINRLALAEANEFSTGTEFLPLGQPLLIPLDCQCSSGFFEAELTKTTLKGESFNGIAQSLEGLTTCKAIQEKNPTAPPWSLADKQHLLVPVRCACPPSAENTHRYQFLLSYPVSLGDTLASLASSFNATPEDILSANQKSRADPKKVELLVPFSTLIIPVRDKPRFRSLANPWQPTLPIIKRHKKKAKKRMIVVYIAIAGVAAGASLAIGAAFLLIQWKRKNHGTCKGGDVELQQLGLSVRTTSEKKASFEGSHDDSINGSVIDSTPHKTLMEAYTVEELQKATENFGLANLIEDSVYHGRLSGNNLAIKRTSSETIPKIEWALYFDASHRHPNIIRVLGTCTEGADSYLVFEYAKNGSLKDWLHGGLAMKSQFIASCYCFLTWNQRVRICLDVGAALQYMHHIMSPPYIHRNIKSRNIFLDEEFKAKVGNFGMARCIEDSAEEDHQVSSPIHPAACWNRGYLAPEYLEQGVISPSIDIFAYGVVMLEILSGQTPITKGNTETGEGHEVRLSETIKSILRSENADELRRWIDTALGDSYPFDTAVTLANLAGACVEDDPSLRPSSGEIVEKLSRMVEELMPEGDEFASTISESSCKPLVKSAAEKIPCE